MPSTQRRSLRAAALGLAALFASAAATAAVLTFTPSVLTTSAGTPVVVDVRVSDLGAGNVLGAFDLDVAFDPSLLSFGAVAFGPSLGNPALFEALTSVSTAAPGVIDFGEVSLLSAAELATAQAASFSIATLTFNGVAAGSTGLQLLGTSLLSDAFGRALPINAAVAAVPEPESVALLGIGLAAAAWARRRAQAQRRGAAQA